MKPFLTAFTALSGFKEVNSLHFAETNGISFEGGTLGLSSASRGRMCALHNNKIILT